MYQIHVPSYCLYCHANRVHDGGLRYPAERMGLGLSLQLDLRLVDVSRTRNKNERYFCLEVQPCVVEKQAARLSELGMNEKVTAGGR